MRRIRTFAVVISLILSLFTILLSFSMAEERSSVPSDHEWEIILDSYIVEIVKRTNDFVELARAIDEGYLATPQELEELDCHVVQNSNWIKCDWPYSANLCSQAGGVPHGGGTCCIRID